MIKIRTDKPHFTAPPARLRTVKMLEMNISTISLVDKRQTVSQREATIFQISVTSKIPCPSMVASMVASMAGHGHTPGSRVSFLFRMSIVTLFIPLKYPDSRDRSATAPASRAKFTLNAVIVSSSQTRLGEAASRTNESACSTPRVVVGPRMDLIRPLPHGAGRGPLVLVQMPGAPERLVGDVSSTSTPPSVPCHPEQPPLQPGSPA